MKTYYVNIPGMAGHLTIIAYDEKDARKRLRDREGYGKRLPNGTKLFLKIS